MKFFNITVFVLVVVFSGNMDGHSTKFGDLQANLDNYKKSLSDNNKKTFETFSKDFLDKYYKKGYRISFNKGKFSVTYSVEFEV